MKKNAVAVNPIAKTITISKAYYKKACIYGTSEYYEFRTVLSENEGFTVDFKVIEKKTYKDLTFERMEEYIKSTKTALTRSSKVSRENWSKK